MISAAVPSISPVAPAISSRWAHISQLPSSQFCTPTNLPFPPPYKSSTLAEMFPQKSHPHYTHLAAGVFWYEMWHSLNVGFLSLEMWLPPLRGWEWGICLAVDANRPTSPSLLVPQFEHNIYPNLKQQCWDKGEGGLPCATIQDTMGDQVKITTLLVAIAVVILRMNYTSMWTVKWWNVTGKELLSGSRRHLMFPRL